MQDKQCTCKLSPSLHIISGFYESLGQLFFLFSIGATEGCDPSIQRVCLQYKVLNKLVSID